MICGLLMKMRMRSGHQDRDGRQRQTPSQRITLIAASSREADRRP